MPAGGIFLAPCCPRTCSALPSFLLRVTLALAPNSVSTSPSGSSAVFHYLWKFKDMNHRDTLTVTRSLLKVRPRHVCHFDRRLETKHGHPPGNEGRRGLPPGAGAQRVFLLEGISAHPRGSRRLLRFGPVGGAAGPGSFRKTRDHLLAGLRRGGRGRVVQIYGSPRFQLAHAVVPLSRKGDGAPALQERRDALRATPASGSIGWAGRLAWRATWPAIFHFRGN